MKSIEMCTNRFDDDTKNSFVELYTKVDVCASADQIMDQQKKRELESQMNPMIVSIFDDVRIRFNLNLSIIVLVHKVSEKTPDLKGVTITLTLKKKHYHKFIIKLKCVKN